MGLRLPPNLTLWDAPSKLCPFDFAQGRLWAGGDGTHSQQVARIPTLRRPLRFGLLRDSLCARQIVAETAPAPSARCGNQWEAY